MSVILINLPGFVEQSGERIVEEKPNSLDTIDSIFVGPASLASSFRPRPRTPHLEHPLMYCSRSEIVTQTHALAEVRVSYVGKLVGGGVYNTNPTINSSSRIGSISYTSSAATYVGGYHTYSYTTRYTTTGASFKYLTNRPGNPRFASQANQYLRIENILTFQNAPIAYSIGTAANPAAGWGGYAVNTLVFHNDLVNYGVNDLDNGWYEVTEEYQMQPYINCSIPSYNPVF